MFHLIYSSPEPKAPVSFSDHILSGVPLSVCPSVWFNTFYTFNFSNTIEIILTKLGSSIIGYWVLGNAISINKINIIMYFCSFQIITFEKKINNSNWILLVLLIDILICDHHYQTLSSSFRVFFIMTFSWFWH